MPAKPLPSGILRRLYHAAKPPVYHGGNPEYWHRYWGEPYREEDGTLHTHHPLCRHPGWLARLWPILCAKDIDQLEAWADEEGSPAVQRQEKEHLLKAHRMGMELAAEVRRDSPGYTMTMDQGRVPEEMILQARSTPMEALVGPITRGKIACLWHPDKKPSMTVYPDGVHCYVCGKHLNPIDWVMETMGLSFPAAVRHLAGARL